MPTSYVIKINAKTSLKDKWPTTLGIGAILLTVCCLVFVLIQTILTLFLPLVGEVWALIIGAGAAISIVQFLISPLLYGTLRWFWFTSSDADVPINEIFCYFIDAKSYLRAQSLSFRIFMRIAFVMTIGLLPSIIVMLLSSPSVYELFGFSLPYWTASIWLLGQVLLLFGIIFSFILLMRYFAAPILMINDNSITPQEALHLSVIISKNAGGKTIGFLFSFAGWGLLSLLFIPLLYSIPYFMCAYAVFCRFLINHYNRLVATPTPTFTGYSGNLEQQ